MGDWKPRMQKAVRHLADQLAGIRPGTLSVGFVETFRVALQGQSAPLGRLLWRIPNHRDPCRRSGGNSSCPIRGVT